MRKRILSLLLAVCLLSTMIPVTAFAAGTLEGVDYTRIKQNTTLTKQVTFKVGGRTFTGQLSNGKTLSTVADGVKISSGGDIMITTSEQTKLSSTIQCICILISKFPHISRELMGSFSFCYSNSTVTESPSVFSLT